MFQSLALICLRRLLLQRSEGHAGAKAKFNANVQEV